MFDAETIQTVDPAALGSKARAIEPKSAFSLFYAMVKRAGDFFAAIFILPFALISALLLLILNPFFNKGPLLYRQTRMGKNCQPFTAYKFRSMSSLAPKTTEKRGAFDELEEHRITKLGRIMRKLRIDELPQALNILKGDMSLIGPRPDFIDHARVYILRIPGYRERHNVRPGVTGLAQTEVGYVSDEAGFRRKVAADLTYIRKMGFTYDLKIMVRTAQIILCGRGR